MSFYSFLLRASFRISDTLRDAGLRTPADVVRYDNILYGTDPRWQSLDVYRPRSAAGRPLPVIVSVHGGGWVYGSKDLYQYYCMSLARRGFAVVNFSYRLAPAHKFPAALEDTNAVFYWVLANAEKYGFDRRRIFAVGDSAGANILGLYAAFCASPGSCGGILPPAGFVPAAIALNCGQYRIFPGAHALINRLLPDLFPDRGSAEELQQADVPCRVGAGYPPCFVMTANKDFLRDQAPLLVSALRNAGIPYVFRCYGDDAHRLGHVFHCNIRSAAAQACNSDECAFFNEFL